MASTLRLPAMRRLLASRPLRLSSPAHQRRWARVHDARFLSASPSSFLIAEKYRSKLDEKAKAEGLASIDDLKLAYADKIQEQRKRDAILHPLSVAPSSSEAPVPQAPETPVKQPMKDAPLPTPTPRTERPQTPNEAEVPQSPETPVKQPNTEDPSTPTAPGTMSSQIPKAAAANPGQKLAKTLEDFIDVEKVKDLPEKELSAIWRLRHANRPDALCAIIPAATYSAMDTLARKCPQFVLPVPHESQGAEIHFLQWTFDAATRTSTVLFTQLAEYKARGEFAQPHTTITHHLDFAADKGLVLMQGQVVDGRGAEVEHAKWLVLCLQKFYGGWEAEAGDLSPARKERADERQKLLNWFANGDPQFSVEKLLDEAERMG